MEVIMELQLNLPRSRASGGEAHTAAIQLVAASTGRKKKKKITVISFHFLRWWRPPRAKQKCFQPLRLAAPAQAGDGEEGGDRVAARVSPCDLVREQGTLSSHAVRLKTLAATGESCQAFSGIDPARLWLAGSQKTKYFLLLQLGKEI